MSVFKVNPDEFGPKHGYPKNRNPFQNSRFGYTLDNDLKRGLKEAVDNSQVNLALEYLSLIVQELDAHLCSQGDEKPEVQEDKEPAPDSPRAHSQKTVKRTATAEEGAD